MKFNRLFVAALFGIFSTSALADRVVTDQLDRQVTIPIIFSVLWYYSIKLSISPCN